MNLPKIRLKHQKVINSIRHICSKPQEERQFLHVPLPALNDLPDGQIHWLKEKPFCYDFL